MQVAFGVLPRRARDVHLGSFFALRRKETREEFERAEKSDAPRDSLRKRKFAKFAYALAIKVLRIAKPLKSSRTSTSSLI